MVHKIVWFTAWYITQNEMVWYIKLNKMVCTQNGLYAKWFVHKMGWYPNSMVHKMAVNTKWHGTKHGAIYTKWQGS